jgi:hypothetical protein
MNPDGQYTRPPKRPKASPILGAIVRQVRAVRERERVLVEVAGIVLIVCALWLVSIPVAIGFAGLVLVAVANLYMGRSDADTNDRDSADTENRQ